MAAAAELALLRLLAARGRFTGTEALHQARAHCAGHLRTLGFTPVELPFTYSAAPARFGMPAVGFASVALLPAVSWVRAESPAAGALAAAVALVLLRVLAHWLGSARAQAMPWLRRHGINLQAVGSVEPRVWLVAHLDSKSQQIPLAVRAAGAALTIAAWSAAVVVAAAGALWHAEWSLAPAVVVGIAGGVLLGLASVGNDSPGAVDNASGVATVLAAAARLGSGAAVGVLITDAEEVGLAGAHAWARDRRPGVAVNCDTVDDHGAFRVLSAGGGSREVVRAARAARDRCGVDVRAGRTPAGVLTDATALAGAGWASATLSRATFGTLMRIHTPRDSVGMLEGRSIDQAAALLAATVEELL